MRSITIACDNCGKAKPQPPAERPATWWEVHPVGASHRVGSLDFCSLPCLAQWVDAPEIRSHVAYREDFHPTVTEPTDARL
jgi:hypothetical protein